MKYCKKNIGSSDKIRSFIGECEADFETRLDASVAQACADRTLKVITLSGPTCSGKTTAAKKLIGELEAIGKKVHIVSIDDFYRDKQRIPKKDGKPDLDSIDAIDLTEFERFVGNVFAGEPAALPRFDFISGCREGFEIIDPDDDDMFLFEGIQAVYPEITALLRKADRKSIFICVEQGIDVGGSVFMPNDIRLIRRIVRDHNFRGASPEYTFFLWEGVRENEEKNILPYADDCDIRIDSVMPYEINLMVKYLRPLLQTVGKGSPYRAEAERLLAMTDGIVSFDSHMIPDGSLYYEFIKRKNA